jgi:hypothetical protein
MKTTIKLLCLALITSSAALAETKDFKIIIKNSETMYEASVTQEQIEQNIHTKHILNGQIVDRELAKTAFIEGETSCRVFLDGISPKITNNQIVSLGMEIPTKNRKMLAFENNETLLAFTCQSSKEISRESVLKALGSLVEVVK